MDLFVILGRAMVLAFCVGVIMGAAVVTVVQLTQRQMQERRCKRDREASRSAIRARLKVIQNQSHE